MPVAVSVEKILSFHKFVTHYYLIVSLFFCLNCTKHSFPHDKHDLVLKLGIMKHRQKDRRWDMKKWRLGLAEEGDSQKTIRVPHGLIVDHVEVPGFSFEKEKNPIFEIVPLLYGPDAVDGTAVDECLQIRLQVRRDSGYYDNNIIPLLTMLNFAAIATLVLDPLEFGNRGEILLAIAFVSVGIRMSADTKLPGVSYQIKLQLILNKFCYTLLFLHIESALVYYLADRCGWEIEQTEIINNCTMICATIYTVALLFSYYIHDGRILKLL